MTPQDLIAHLDFLRLTQTEAAQLLGVSARTLRRWLEGGEIPGPAEAALRAWRRLAERNLPWRSDSVSIVEDDQDQIARHRAHAIDLSAMLDRVEARGGARLPWEVDLQDAHATLGAMEVSFYRLLNGGFSLGTYTRRDGDPDVRRDWEFIEDAAYCIAQALKKGPAFGPVVLAWYNVPWKQGVQQVMERPFSSNEAAIQHACVAIGSPGFHDAVIREPNRADLLWDKHELRRECDRRRKIVAALQAVADYARKNAALFVRGGPVMGDGSQRQQIETLAGAIEKLAEPTKVGSIKYQDFEAILGQLHKLGFFPENAQVSAVARALLRA
jgi:hypothetical protein